MANLVYVVVALICAVAVTNARIPVPSNFCKIRKCPAGTVCKDTGIVCISQPCPTTMCVPVTSSPVNPCHFRKCPVGYVCKETGIVCITTPCPTTTCVKITKPGKCPKLQGYYHLMKHCNPKPRCKRDSDCKGNLKCCGYCPVCTRPVFPKPGSCPKLPVLSTSRRVCIAIARHHCGIDQDCDGRKKCCGTCPRRCVNPLFIWKG